MDSQGIVYSDTTNIQRKYYHKNREEIMIISEGNLKSEHWRKYLDLRERNSAEDGW